MEEKELFEDYEHKVWEWTPSFYKIIATAVIFNFVGLFAIGQFDILQTKGCDTPFVGIVCQALDSAYVASVFMGKDLSADSTPYPKTEIGDDQEVTFIDVSNQLTYPDGYFALANPPENLDVLPTDTQVPSNFNLGDSNNSFGNTSSPKSDKDMGAAVLPRKNDSVGNQDSEELPYRVGGDDKKPSYKTPQIAKTRTPKPVTTKKLPNDSPKDLPGDVVAKATPKPTPAPTPTDAQAVEGFEKKFNNQPLKDFAEDVIAKVDSKDPKTKVDLTQPFKVVLDGTLTADGKFDAKKTKFVVNKGEDQIGMILVAKDAIEKLGESGLLSYLKDLGADKVNITLVQDDKQIFAVIRSDQPNDSKARTISSGFNFLIGGAKTRVKEEDVKMLLNAVNFKAEGKSFIINFAMPKDEAHKLIDQKLQEARQKKSQTNSDENGKESTAKTK